MMQKKIVFALALLVHTLSFAAGSLIKLDLSSYESLNKTLKATQEEYSNQFRDFRPLPFSPNARLLFLSNKDDGSDLTKNINSDEEVVELVKGAVLEVAREVSPFKVATTMKLIHQRGTPYGVGSVSIAKDQPYFVVIIELPGASDALKPLVEKLEEKTLSRVTLDNTVQKFPFRMQMTVGYVVGETIPANVDVKSLGEAKFEVNSMIMDFPKVEGFHDLEIPLSNLSAK